MQQLTKSDDEAIFGVCGGIAEYFGWSAIGFRIAWVIFTLLIPKLVIIYILLAIMLPEKNTRVPRIDDVRRKDLDYALHNMM